ncbi:MAG: MG2 domain-containing protein [Chthoniobacterales bacterium]
MSVLLASRALQWPPVFPVVHTLPRSNLRAALILLGVLSVAGAAGAVAPNESRGVRLVLGAGVVSPSSTFELRFDQAMVLPQSVGFIAKNSPLVITPALPGSFVWLSQRSGVFTPSAPLALATTYQLRLATRLTTADGKPSDARLEAQVQTPPMSVTDVSPSSFREKDAPSSPKIVAQFNVRVKSEALASFVEFRDAAGHSIGGLTSPATAQDGDFEGPANTQKAWRDRFKTSPNDSSKNDSADDEKEPVPNRVVIRSAAPLSPGAVWRCILKKGLPAGDGPEKLPSDFEIKIGKVLAFAVESVEAHNTLEGGKRIRVGFTKSLSPLLKEAEAPQWVSVAPAPANLHFDLGDSSIAVHGDFQLDQQYTVTVNPGLPAEEPFTLAQKFTKKASFVPLPPRLYFPALTTTQLSGGRRTFELESINLPAASVRARSLDRASVVFALAGYKSGYARKSNASSSDLEPYRGLPFELVPGKTIFEETVETAAPRDQARTVSLSWDHILGGRRTGVVFLSAEGSISESGEEAKTVGTQAIVQLTDIGLVWKFNGADAWIYAFSEETGLPLANVTMRLLTNDNETLLSTKTSDAGLAHFHRDARSQWLMAENGDDFHVLEFGPHPVSNVPLYAFKIPYGYWEPRNLEPVFLFSDRPLYQPGESIHLKGIVRSCTDTGLALPRPLSFQLRLNDPDDQKIWEKQVALSPQGTFAEDIALPNGRLGSYTALADFGHNTTRALSVEVQEYKPAPFEIALMAKDSYSADEVVRANVTANYYHGKPLANALLRWSLSGSDAGFHPPGFDQFVFGPQADNGDEEQEEATTKFAAQGELHLADDGTANIAPEVSTNPAQPQPRQCNLLVEITDLGQATISERRSFLRQSSDFYLGLQRPDDVLVAGHPLPIKLVAVQPDGKPRAPQVNARVVIEKRNFHTVREQGAGGALNYHTETRFAPVFDDSVAALPLQKSGERWAVAPAGAAEFTPNEVGSYRLRALAKDEAGHPVETSFDFSVAATEPQKTDWDYRNEAQVDLVPDKASYAPGQTANILVKTPINGTALVTIEQDRVRRAFLTRLEGNAPVVRVPIEKTDAPDVFVSVLALRGRAQSPRRIKTPEYRVGYAQLNVVRAETRLAVSIESGDPAYRPGAEVTTTVMVKNSGGRPVASADVALYAVDEGVLALMGYKTPDPCAFFYDTQPLRVQTGLSLPNLFPEDATALTFSNKGYLVGGGGEESAPSALRKNFLGTAFWKADLRTGADGRAAAQFTAPDNLTRFRLMAVVNAGADRFGSGESNFEVNKPLMFEPALPNFATVGDKLIARAILHNRSAASGEAEVTLQLDDKTREQTPLVRRLTLPAGASRAIDFPVGFQNAGNAHWIWTARLKIKPAPIADAVESNLPVGLAAPLLQEILTGRTQAAESDLLASANPQFLEGTGRLEVSVANTRLLGLVEPVAYLLHYPYGCAEQTISNMLPWIVAPQLRTVVPELDVPNDKAARAITLGINRLLEMQTEDGGIGFWPHDREPSLWASAYGGVALALAQRSGWPVPASTLTRLADYLSNALRDSGELQDNFELSDRCLALYALALAGRPENSYHEIFFNKRARLSAESRALLALAILESHGPAAMVEELINPQSPMEPQGEVYFGSAERELAVRLLAWSQFRPADPEVDTLVAELLRGQHNGRWENTQSNAWALLGLTKYATQVETGERNASGSVDYNGDRHPFQLDERKRAFAEEQPIARAAPGASPVPLTLTNPQARLLFTQVKMEARPPVGLQPRQDRGFLLQRRYQKVMNDGSLAAADSLGVGDRVLVTLQIEVRQPAHFVAIDDALPAIFEAVNPEFKTQALRGLSDVGEDWISDYRELRRDRALFFCNHLAPGSYTLHYLARVRAAGDVTAPPARIEEMYHPDRFGLSEAVRIRSKALE